MHSYLNLPLRSCAIRLAGLADRDRVEPRGEQRIDIYRAGPPSTLPWHADNKLACMSRRSGNYKKHGEQPMQGTATGLPTCGVTKF
eukprot:SAG22_NODE_2276_length_2762_cov_4.876455_3_plen_86_part_00